MSDPATRKVRLFRRQRNCLALLEAVGGRAGKTDFQKLLFLYGEDCRCRGLDAPYDFVPHRFGPYSFTAKRDRTKLTELGLLAAGDAWSLTTQGAEAAATESDGWVAAFARRWQGVRGDPLIAEVYRDFPYFAIRSEIVDRVLADDPAARRQIDRAKPSEPPTPLATIGYEGLSYEAYFDRLLRAGTTLLCDVRRNPISRKWGFSKSTLAAGCQELGVRYEHLPELGIPSSARADMKDRQRLFDDYARSTLVDRRTSLQRIRAWVDDGHRVALTCFERQSTDCHRSRVSAAVASMSAAYVEPRHLH